MSTHVQSQLTLIVCHGDEQQGQGNGPSTDLEQLSQDAIDLLVAHELNVFRICQRREAGVVGVHIDPQRCPLEDAIKELSCFCFCFSSVLLCTQATGGSSMTSESQRQRNREEKKRRRRRGREEELSGPGKERQSLKTKGIWRWNSPKVEVD